MRDLLTLIDAFAGLLLYYSFVGGLGLAGAGTAPDVAWFAYAPLTERAFSPGHTTDYWAVSLIASGIGSIGTAVNFLATIFCMRLGSLDTWVARMIRIVPSFTLAC